jgi:RNA polymerase sigma-54 factor
MVSLQPKLNLKVSQRQILTPGLMQMVSVLALNKLELKDMIQAEIAENPVLEELEESVPMLDHVAEPEQQAVAVDADKPDPFEEIDFGSYFQEYLDPGFRSPQSFEVNEKPSLESYLSKPGSLEDHLTWQIGSLSLAAPVRYATEYIVGNLNEDGYLSAPEQELLEGFRAQMEMHLAAHPDLEAELLLAEVEETFRAALTIVRGLDPVGVAAGDLRGCLLAQINAAREESSKQQRRLERAQRQEADEREAESRRPQRGEAYSSELLILGDSDDASELAGLADSSLLANDGGQPYPLQVQVQLQAQAHIDIASNGHHSAGNGRASALQATVEAEQPAESDESASYVAYSHTNGAGAQTNGSHGASATKHATLSDPLTLHPQSAIYSVAERIVDKHLLMLQKRDLRELAKAAATTVEQANLAFEFIRTLDPRPGQRFNRADARLIEPDVAFVKRDDEYVAVMDDESVPTLRLNQGYRRLLKQPSAEKDVKDYVKERYRSALQLMRNIEQRKNTILRTCEVIVRRQTDFLERGVEALHPMMIKEVAEEIGVHPSTVSRAVSNKYVHTPQGVFELRFFFTEGVSGPEGSGTPLLLLKRKVKKLIEEEDPRKPLTDELITHMLQSQGIDVTRRTVAKYREDLRIPSTHQRRVRD